MEKVGRALRWRLLRPACGKQGGKNKHGSISSTEHLCTLDFAAGKREQRGSISALLVYLVQQGLARKKPLQVVRDEPVVALPQALGYGCGMRRDEQIVELPERRIRRQRFFFKNIQRGASDRRSCERMEQAGSSISGPRQR